MASHRAPRGEWWCPKQGLLDLRLLKETTKIRVSNIRILQKEQGITPYNADKEGRNTEFSKVKLSSYLQP